MLAVVTALPGATQTRPGCPAVIRRPGSTAQPGRPDAVQSSCCCIAATVRVPFSGHGPTAPNRHATSGRGVQLPDCTHRRLAIGRYDVP